MKNAFYAQSGGVTSVINVSAYGVIKKVRALDNSSKIFVGKNGIVGLLEDEIFDLDKTKKSLELLKELPGGAFGSCRYKLPEITETDFYEVLFKKLDKKNIRYFFYNGGNDSADTCLKISLAGKRLGYDLNAIAIPKTIDNDLVLTDNCPGFGSVAKYVATSSKEASLDIKSMCKTSTKVFIFEVMGRHAGWIAASSELANNEQSTFVHKILLPEVPFDEYAFLSGVENDIAKYGYSVIVASEGLKNQDGSLFSNSGEKDAFGHIQLGGLAPKLANLLSNSLKVKYHWSVSDYLQRSARHISSKVDFDHALAVGEHAADLAFSGETGVMPIIKRTNIKPYTWEIKKGMLQDIANKEKTLPGSYISEDGFRISEAGVNYLKPLIQGEIFPKFKNGVPSYDQLDLHLC